MVAKNKNIKKPEVCLIKNRKQQIMGILGLVALFLCGVMVGNGIEISHKKSAEEKSVDVAKEEIITREKSEALRYMEIHNIDISNMDIYDIIINTGTFNPENVSEIIIQTLKVI